MRQKRNKDVRLNVKAVETASVREIDVATGRPMMGLRFVGKEWSLDEDGNSYLMSTQQSVMIAFHAHYIDALKQGTLLAVDQATANLANVFVEGKDPWVLALAEKKEKELAEQKEKARVLNQQIQDNLKKYALSSSTEIKGQL